MRFLVAVLLLCLLPLGALLVQSARVKPPHFDRIRAAWVPSEAYLLDRHGELLQSLRLDSSVRRLEWTKLADVSPALLRAILLAEDRRFYQHSGVDPRALGAALVGGLRHGRVRGASTLSMQTAAFLEPGLAARQGARNLAQKFSQMAYALALERAWTKNEILEAYLNLAGFHGELQGIAATARGLFGKAPSGLDASESVLLAALLPAPSSDLTRLRTRACAIAAACSFRVRCPSLRALATQVFAKPPNLPVEADLASHLARLLLKQPGERRRTTIDARWQRLASDALRQQLMGLDRDNVRDGAALVADNRTGEILAYVGSAGPESHSPRVDGVAARRQAGSTLKPFLYGLALERRYVTPASVLMDAPVHLETPSGLYIPQDYDRDFKGPVSVRTALAGSLNVPAVRILVLLGTEHFRDGLRALGYDGIKESGGYYGYSLALGSAEVSLLEQVNAYRALANGGLWTPLRLTDDAPSPVPRRVLREGAAFLVANILSDGAARALTFGLDSPLATRFWTAVKTGTSKNMRDNWCIGFSSRYTVGVWVGNFEGDSMRGVSGVSGAAPAWLAIMNALHAAEPGTSPEPPAGVVAREIRYTPTIEPSRREWFIDGTEAGEIHVTESGSHGPRIEAPARGVIVALDPDIPAGSQQLLFRASAAGTAEFILDGASFGPAERSPHWLPEPGRHVLQLKARDGRVLDTIRFQVRAPRP